MDEVKNGEGTVAVNTVSGQKLTKREREKLHKKPRKPENPWTQLCLRTVFINMFQGSVSVGYRNGNVYYILRTFPFNFNKKKYILLIPEMTFDKGTFGEQGQKCAVM